MAYTDEEMRERQRGYSRKWYAANPEKVRESTRKWREANLKKRREYERKRYAEKVRRDNLKKQYGLSPAAYEAMLIIQGDVCDLCGKIDKSSKIDKSGRHLAVDHCHKSGKVRGLLCSACNTAYERVDSMPDWPEKAIAYRERHIVKIEKLNF